MKIGNVPTYRLADARQVRSKYKTFLDSKLLITIVRGGFGLLILTDQTIPSSIDGIPLRKQPKD